MDDREHPFGWTWGGFVVSFHRQKRQTCCPPWTRGRDELSLLQVLAALKFVGL